MLSSRYAECHYAECHMLNIIMVSVVMLNVIMLSVMAPSIYPKNNEPDRPGALTRRQRLHAQNQLTFQRCIYTVE